MNAIIGLLPRTLSAPTLRTADRIPGTSESAPSRVRGRGQLHILHEELFKDILTREWKRAGRFDQSFALVLVASSPDDASPAWAGAIAALTAIRHDTDVLGWFKRGNVLALLRPDINVSDLSVASDIEQQVRRELGEQLDRKAAESFSARVHVPAEADMGAASVADPVSEALRSANGRIRAIKRALDIAGSLVLLAILSPLFLLIATLMKLTSPGPVFFRQVRVGASGKPFTMLKFRTMRVGADHILHQQFVTDFIKAGSGTSPSNDNGLFKIVNDPRVTFIGRLLRKTSFDELPQLWNVLRGDMSLVGPRPPLPYEVEQYKRWHYRRVLEAKPGITGLWQVTGRSRTSFDDMVRLDLRYAQNQSAWTDIKILLATPRAVISGKGAC